LYRFTDIHLGVVAETHLPTHMYLCEIYRRVWRLPI
jgi:hypothetical protein